MGRKKKYFLTSEEHKDSEKKPALPEEKKEEKKLFQVFGEKDILLSKTDFIDYQKINNKMLFLQFHLMGQFDENGKYYIKEDIRRDLVRVQKEIQEEDDKGFLAEVRYAKVLFNFEVEIEYEDANAKASLFIIEKVDDQTIKTLLDSFSDANEADFRIKVRQRFNLVDVAVTMRDDEVPNMNIWLYWQNEEYLYWKDLYEMGSQFFVLRALAILEGYGELGAKIIERYNAKLSQFEDSLPNRKYSKAKELLDEAINEFGGIEKVDEGKGKLEKLSREFNKPFYVSESTQAMLYEKDSTKKPSSNKATTKQEDYGYNDNGKFVTAKADPQKKKEEKPKSTKVTKPAKKTTYVSVDPSSAAKQKDANAVSANVNQIIEEKPKEQRADKQENKQKDPNVVTEEETKAILQDVLKMTTSEKAQNEESTISINAQGPESTTSGEPKRAGGEKVENAQKANKTESKKSLNEDDTGRENEK